MLIREFSYRLLFLASKVRIRLYSGQIKVTLIGASGAIGQSLSLLLKTMPGINKLALYDICESVTGIGMDLSHINTSTRVTSHVGAEKLCDAISDSHIIVIAANMPRKEKMSQGDLFNSNASIIYGLSRAIAKIVPNALVAIITYPVNSMVPIAYETLKNEGVRAANRLFGVTTLNVIRAAAFIGEINECDPATVVIPVIGGQSGKTAIPVLSQCRPRPLLFQKEEIEKFIKRVQEADVEVVNAKAGAGSATLSMAYASADLVNKLLKGIKGEKSIVCAYVRSNKTASPFFSNPIVLGAEGIQQNLGLGNLKDYEIELVKTIVPHLIKCVKRGERYVECRRLQKQKCEY